MKILALKKEKKLVIIYIIGNWKKKKDTNARRQLLPLQKKLIVKKGKITIFNVQNDFTN